MANDSEISNKSDPKDLEFIEWKLTSAIEQKLFLKAKIYLGVFLAGVTLFGFFGINYMVETTSRKIEKEVLQKIDRETAVLEARLRENLVDFSMKATEIKKKSEDAKNHLEKLLADYQSLDDMKKRNESLFVEVEKLQKEVHTASVFAVSIEVFRKKTESEFRVAEDRINRISDAIVNAAANKPAVVQWSQDNDKKIIRLKGFNFEKPGIISVRPAWKVTDGTTFKYVDYVEWYDIEEKNYIKWNNSEIEFSIGPKFGELMNKARIDMQQKLMQQNLSVISQTQQVRVGTRSAKYIEFYTSEIEMSQ
jgi:hypothetical protein